ncbi:MAG: hypothetical protein KAU17_16730 [Spirochaetales bacterium]|jgi:hypothetical protein|nr:hypothetical protein [Spirochaetales bacterium]
MSGDEKNRFSEHSIPKLIGAIPLLAGSDEPERTALDHLSTYILALNIA